MKLECNECHKRFTVSAKNMDPRCPYCGGVDVDVEDFFFSPKPRKVVSRNYSTGPFDFAPESA